jgi:hypothetical protein
MEHIIVSNIMSFYDKHDILSKFQHGFRSKLICEIQLISFTQEVHDNLEQGQQTDVIDFSKAFDKVDHHKLLLKLHRLGVSSEVINWTRSFLYSRTQQDLLSMVKTLTTYQFFLVSPRLGPGTLPFLILHK